MASTSGSSKDPRKDPPGSKRSKKNDASEWSDDNSSDDSKSTNEDITPGKRLKTDYSSLNSSVCIVSSDEEDANYDQTSKDRKGESSKDKASKKDRKGESSKDKASKNDQKGESSKGKTSKNDQKGASGMKDWNAEPASKTTKKGESSKDKGNKLDNKGESSNSSQPQADSERHSNDKTTMDNPDEEINDSGEIVIDLDLSSEHDEEIFNIAPNPVPLDMASIRAEAEMFNSEPESTRNESESDPEPSIYDPLTPESIKKYDPTPKTPRPKHKWSIIDHLTSRQYGTSAKYPSDITRRNCCGSLHVVERLELMYKMKKHEGCVNTLNFNSSGSKLVSGSDDLSVIIWDWTVGEHILEYRSGHNTNVFQAKFMPMCDDTKIVTCARDGQVRYGQIMPDGTCKGTRKLAQHKGSVHKLAIQSDNPSSFLTCGEDTAVFSIDLREERPSKILSCKHNGKKVPLYSIFSNPQRSHEFVVTGRCQFVKVYDRRFLSETETPIHQFCPEHMAGDGKFNVTCAVYNYSGDEILASYNDEDIYLFNAKETSSSKYLHRYRGHRNSQTVKGVNFFGPKSEYIVSGSDCGNIFFWDKESEHIVKYMYGDEGGAVNCLEPHPTVPILATSGLDDDIKIWVPSCEYPPDMSNLQRHIIQNMKSREEDSREHPDAFVDQTIWFLMQHLSRARRATRDDDNGASNSNSSSSTVSDDEYDVDISPSRCNQS